MEPVGGVKASCELSIKQEGAICWSKRVQVGSDESFFMSVEKLKKRHKRVWRGGAQVRVEF